MPIYSLNGTHIYKLIGLSVIQGREKKNGFALFGNI